MTGHSTHRAAQIVIRIAQHDAAAPFGTVAQQYRRKPKGMDLPRKFSLLTRGSTGSAAALFAAALISVPTGAAQAAPATVENEIAALAQQYLQAGADTLVTNAAPAKAAAAAADGNTALAMSAAMRAQVLALRARLAAERAALAAADVTYSRSRVTIESRTVTVTGNTATITLRDVTELIPTDPAEPPTEQAVNRTLEYTKAGTTWSLQDETIEAGSMAPITAPDLDVNALPVEKYSGPIGTSPADVGTDAPLDDAEKNEDRTWQDPELIETQVSGSAPTGTDAKEQDEGAATMTAAGGATIMARPKNMCYGCMVDYAYKHYKNYNKNYRVFKSNDCTNFISQIMRRGGWKYDLGWYRSNSNWWYNSMNQTHTWAGAENWSRFAPKRTNRLANVWSLSLADVLQMDFNRDGTMDHSMVVTKTTSKDIYLTYHSADTKDRPLRAILKKHPRAKYYAYRT